MSEERLQVHGVHFPSSLGAPASERPHLSASEREVNSCPLWGSQI